MEFSLVIYQEVKIVSGFVQYAVIRERRISKPSGGRLFNMSVPDALSFLYA